MCDRYELEQEAVKRLGILTRKGLDQSVLDAWPDKVACFLRNSAKSSVLMTIESASFASGRDLEGELKDFEKANPCAAYLTALTQTDFGTILDIFYVSCYEEEWEDDRSNLERGCACNYAMNLDDDICSEFGWETFAINDGNLIGVQNRA